MKAFRDFKINWRAKALAFNALDRMPLGRPLYYRVQRHITHTIPRVFSPTVDSARVFLEHGRVLAAHSSAHDLHSLSVFEFGAGWDLYGNCVAWCLGVEQQTVYDLTRWARGDQINLALAHLRKEPPPGAVRTPEIMLPNTGPFEDALKAAYGIAYCAPADASATGLPDGTFDCALTTSVLEHIPPAQIASILKECHRILRPGGIMSHAIDYSDHFAHSDPGITPYNYLSFDEQVWRRFNPDIHYQNRMRHVDYVRLFEDAGFRILSEMSEQPEDAAAMLAKVKLSPQYAGRPISELAPLAGHYVLERV